MARPSWRLLLPACLLGACSGEISGASDPVGGETPRLPGVGASDAKAPGRAPGTGGAPGENVPGATATGACVTGRKLGPSPLRRLTHDEYARTVRDLLRLAAPAALDFPKEGEVWGLTNNVEQQALTASLVERYYGTAERLAALAVTGLGRLTTCDPVVQSEAACSAAFIDETGTRAFRRPLTTEEKQGFAQVFTAGRQDTDFKGGLRAVIEAMLVAPQFLFRTEPQAGAAPIALDGWAVASRLSYMLWSTMPDEALFAAARAGKLQAPQDIAAAADRMLADLKAREVVRRVHSEWLEFDRIEDLRKDSKKFPEFTPALQIAMRGELDRFVDHVFDKHGGRLDALFGSPTSFVDAALAKLYGVPGITGTTLQAVELDPVRRAGILTRAGLLSSLSQETETGLVHRGMFVRERLLCQPVPPPPPNLNAQLPPPDPGLTTRGRFARHKADPSCASCHVLIDPIGLALETYDPIGRWRDSENGVAIDTSGELAGVAGGGFFKNAAELTGQLGRSATVQECAGRVWFRYTFGRTETDADACTLAELKRTTTDGKTRELILSLVQSDAFRTRSP